MKTSTIMWTLAVLIIILGAGAYYYSNTLTESTTAATTPSAEIPNPSGTNLPTGDLAPTPETPIASSTVQVGASSTFQ